MEKQELFDNLNNGLLEERFYVFERNLEKNIPLIEKYGGMERVVSEMAGNHVLVVGGAPSIEREIAVLRKYYQRDSLKIIAVDIALPILTRYGVKPDYVISCETRPMDFMSAIDTTDMRLLAFSCMSNSNLKKWQGEVSFYNWMIRKPPYDSLWKRAGENLGFVATGSIVTTQAVAIALACGIKSLFIMGNDLAFVNGFYSRASLLFDGHLNSSNRLNPLATKEFMAAWRNRQYCIKRGDKNYYTNHQFLGAKYWLEELFEKVDVNIYENSDPGCGKNIEKISFKKYCERYLDRKKSRRKR